MKFDLTFNNLYFSAIALAAGKNRTEIPGSVTANPAKLNDLKYPDSAFGRDPAQAAQYRQSLPVTPRMIDNEISNTPAVMAGQPQISAYQKFAYGLNRAILEGADKITGDLEIFGDPYYLTTGGTLTRDLKLADAYINTLGEAEVTQGAVYINLNFRNPIDLDSSTGFMKFSKNASFSGIYQVCTVTSTFKNGMFSQSLHVIRLPGQAETNQTPVAAADIVTSPYPETASVRSSRSAATTDNGPADPDTYDKILFNKLQAENPTIAKTNISIPVPLIPNSISLNETVLSSLNSVNPGLQVNSVGALLPNQVSLPSVSFSNPLDQVAVLQNNLTTVAAKFTNIDLDSINNLASQGIDLSALTPTPGSSEKFTDLLNKIPSPQPLSVAPIPIPDPRALLDAAAAASGNLAGAIPSIPSVSSLVPSIPSLNSLAGAIPSIPTNVNIQNNPIVNFKSII